MKIQGQRPNVETSAAQRLEGANEQARQQLPVQNRSADRVELSREASLAGQALRVADEAPAVRQDVVERARQQLAAGEVGRDVGKLADSLIDHMIG